MKFNLDKVLIDIEEKQDKIGRYKVKELAEDTKLIVNESGLAAIEFPFNSGLTFMYTNEVARMFARIDEYTAEEFIAILAENTGIF